MFYAESSKNWPLQIGEKMKKKMGLLSQITWLPFQFIVSNFSDSFFIFYFLFFSFKKKKKKKKLCPSKRPIRL